MGLVRETKGIAQGVLGLPPCLTRRLFHAFSAEAQFNYWDRKLEEFLRAEAPKVQPMQSVLSPATARPCARTPRPRPRRGET